MNLRTEKQIKAWLALPMTERFIDPTAESVFLMKKEGDQKQKVVACFTIRSIIAKRGPRRDTKRKKKAVRK